MSEIDLAEDSSRCRLSVFGNGLAKMINNDVLNSSTLPFLDRLLT